MAAAVASELAGPALRSEDRAPQDRGRGAQRDALPGHRSRAGAGDRARQDVDPVQPQGRSRRALQGAAAARRRRDQPVAHRVATVTQEAVGLRLLHRCRRARRRAAGAGGDRCAASRAASSSRCSARIRAPERRRSSGGAIRKDELVEPAIAGIAPYEPGKPIEELERELGGAWGPGGAIKLASNENPYGPSPLGVAAARAALATANLYPDGGSFALRHEAGGAPRRRRGADPRGRRVERDHRSVGADLLCRGRRGGGAAVFVHRLQAGGAEEPARLPRGADGGEPGLRRRRDPGRGLAAHEDPLFRQSEQSRPAPICRASAFERLVEELPARVLLVADEAYFEYAAAADYPDARQYLGAASRAWRRCAPSRRSTGWRGCASAT